MDCVSHVEVHMRNCSFHAGPDFAACTSEGRIMLLEDGATHVVTADELVAEAKGWMVTI